MSNKTKRRLRELTKALGGWFELDLSAAARSGKLRPAYEVDELVQRVADVVASNRHVVVSGRSGVGKTAIVHELVRRTERFAGKSVLQLSLRAGRAGLRRPKDLPFNAHELVDRLIDAADIVVPFFRDLHLAYAFDLEPHFERLLGSFSGSVLTEGETERLAAMFEYSGELERLLVSVAVDEPDRARLTRILDGWVQRQAASGYRVGRSALRAAVELSTRFSTSGSMPREPIELLKQVIGIAGDRKTIDELDVIDRMVDAFGVPRMLVDPRVPLDPARLARRLQRKVVEQEEAIRAVVQAVSAVKAGLADPCRPCGAFLFAGPTGVGKTHLAQSIAEELLGSRERLVRLNMADFANEDDARMLFGNPHAYSMRAQRGELSVRLAGKRCAVLLLDEFEKAHERVRDRFLQLIDEGRFINGLGESAAYRSLIVLATSNAGAEVYRNPRLGFTKDAGEIDRAIERRLLDHFRFELLNRFDRVVHFRPLSRAGVQELARRAVGNLCQRSGLSERGIVIRATDEALSWLGERGYDSHFGARFLHRVIEQNVTAALSSLLLTENPPVRGEIDVYLEGGEVRARLVRSPKGDSAVRRRSNGARRDGLLFE